MRRRKGEEKHQIQYESKWNKGRKAEKDNIKEEKINTQKMQEIFEEKKTAKIKSTLHMKLVRIFASVVRVAFFMVRDWAV